MPRVAKLWRYPVKSLGGEALAEAEVLEDGVRGDRLVHIRDGAGRVVTSRRKPALLGLYGALDERGRATIDGHPWDSPQAAASVRAAAGDDARALALDGPDQGQRFDVLPLTVITDGILELLGHDVRRYRPNVLIEGVPGLSEADWVGRGLRVGDVFIGVKKRRQRCVMTTFHPDTQARDPGVLRKIAQDFGGLVALDCWVIEPGRIRPGAAVEVVDLAPGTEAPVGNGGKRAPAVAE